MSSILILGGVSGVAKALISYLVPESGSPLVKAIRIVDKFSVEPATTYIDAGFKRCLASGFVEYKQANLAVRAQLDDVFDRDGGWNIVVDLTGETRYDRPELIHIQQTHQLALQLAQTAASLKHKPKAYVRLTMPYYEMKSGNGHKEGDKLVPDSARGRWWHETMRGLAALGDLNVVFVRIAAEYGRGTLGGQVVPRVVVGHVYKYLDEDMKFLYNSDLRVHTVHTADIAQALYLAGEWAAKVGKAQAIAQAGEAIHWGFDKSDAWKDVRVVPEKQKVVAPLFNIVDDNDSTQDKLAKAVAEVWKIKYGFHNSAIASLIAHFAKTDFQDMVEDINEKHVEAWSKMLAASNPPILSSPISPFLDEHAFRKMAICFDGSKARRLLGFKPAFPKLEAAELQAIVNDLQVDGLWPRI